MNGNGKGDTPRPISVSTEQFQSNWERTFGKKEKMCEYSGLPNTSSYTTSDDLTQLSQDIGTYEQTIPREKE